MSQHNITEVLFPREVERAMEDITRPLTLHFVENGEREEVKVQPISENGGVSKSYIVFARIKSDVESRTLEGTLTLELIDENVGYSAILEVE